jgi:hypothetical protein
VGHAATALMTELATDAPTATRPRLQHQRDLDAR